MDLKEVILIGVALSMDALGLTISLGINPHLVKRNKIRFILSFAFFQFFFIFLGGVAGRFFDTYIVSIPNAIGGIVVLGIGVIMLVSAFKNDDKDDSMLIKKSMYLILGMSVSIDALVVGFTAFYETIKVLIFIDAILVGLITLFLCTLGFFLCRYARRVEFIFKYADILGGLILLILGMKMMFF
ncbi:manganese efflux pump [Clostridium sp. Sa3CUN1]|uniref:Manganese efflux pump n=1 Tax=Clostridium gallinarum TaxID=2762246 RepID=A0ABR8Q187_9CLOT|nr:manganese efflux pump [Clostridium gallinarum]MBD7914181.1 manganese efflux pump [Clostridium gallinarum]